MYRILLDTNILLDAIVQERPDHRFAMKLAERCASGRDFGMAASLSLKDVYYVLQRDLEEPTVRNVVASLMDCLVIAPIDAEIALDAIVSSEPDFEDGLVRRCAELNDADFIITRDERAFALSTVKSITAREFLNIVEADERTLPF